MVLPAQQRLRGRGIFDHLYRQGRRFHHGSLLLRVAPAKPELLSAKACPSQPQSLRFAVVISSKVSKRAVVRNRLRRLFHGAFLSYGPQLLPLSTPSWLLLSLQPGAADLSSDLLLREWQAVIQQAGLLDVADTANHTERGDLL